MTKTFTSIPPDVLTGAGVCPAPLLKFYKEIYALHCFFYLLFSSAVTTQENCSDVSICEYTAQSNLIPYVGCHSEPFASLKDKLREESAFATCGFFAALRMTAGVITSWYKKNYLT